MNIKEFLRTHYSVLRYPGNRRPYILFWTQIALLLFLLLVLILVFLVDTGKREILYVLLVSVLFVMLSASVSINLLGKYELSAFLTVLAMVVGPWGSIFLDPTVFQGDFMPILYITLSIQLCAILLTEQITLIIAAFHFLMLSGCILFSQSLQQINWPSLISYLVMTSVISIMANLLNRKYIGEINEQKEQLQRNALLLQEAAVRDSLTGLYNRRYLAEIMRTEISRAARAHTPVGIMMVDVDHFKEINDRFGHVFGDYVISSVADILLHNTRESDLVCRYGGDEFVILLPGSTLENTYKRAEAMRLAIETGRFVFEGLITDITLSVGVSAYPDYAASDEALLKSADKALYEAKEAGRNRVVAVQA